MLSGKTASAASSGDGRSAGVNGATQVHIPASDIANRKAGETGALYTQYQVIGNAMSPADVSNPLTSGPFNPTQIRTAYGVNAFTFGGVSGDGTGQTVAIIDAYDDPSFVSSTASNYSSSDLYRFDANFGLPNPPSFTKVNQTGGTSYPAYNSGWAGEIALDVEWVHAMAPNANIILVEATNNSNSNLAAAVNWAKAQPGVTAISMSYGGSEYSSETLDTEFNQAAGHAGVSFFASTGDSGSPGGYPAYSPNVVAVGGTTLTTNGNAYTSETGWSGSGGGISGYFGRPSYQALVTTPSATNRVIPDVSADANPSSGVYVLDTSAGGIGSTATFYQVGGTSLSAPLWAGLSAVINQGRALEGFGPFVGTSLLTRLYTLPAADYHDVTSGSNGGFNAGVGHDAVTGRGSPVGNLLSLHAAGGSVSGSIFADNNGNGAVDGGETGIAGLGVYLDANNNATLDAGESTATTGAAGTYNFADLAGGVSYVVRLAAAATASYIPTAASSLAAALTYGTLGNVNFGLFPKSLTGTAFTARLDATGTIEQIYTATRATGTPAYAIARAALGATTLTLNATGGANTFTLDLSNGNPLGTGGLVLAGGTVADTVSVLGSAGNDTLAVNSTTLLVGGNALTFASLGRLSFALGAGTDRLDVNALAANASLDVDASADAAMLALGTAAGSLDAIFGAVTIAGAGVDDTVSVNDANATAANSYSVGGSAAGPTATGVFDRAGTFGSLTITAVAGAGPRVDLTTGKGNDTIDLTPIAAASLNLYADVGNPADTDTLLVHARVNSGFTPTTVGDGGAFAFTDGSASIAYYGVELARPLAVTAVYDYAGAAPAVAVSFTQDVSASLAAGDLVLANLDDASTPVPAGYAYDVATNTVRFSALGLSDGDYHATIDASAIAAATGGLAEPVALDFFVLAGDANRDRTVNFDDLLILAQNYGQSDRTFGQGDFNYDGSVNFDDLLILAQRYGSSLATLPAISYAALPVGKPRTAGRRVAEGVVG